MDETLLAGYRFLYDHGGPVLRWEAAQALGLPADRTALRADPSVRYWLDRLAEGAAVCQLHGSFDRCLENAAYKLISFGIHEEDDPRLPGINARLLTLLTEKAGSPHFYDTINPTIVAGWLAGQGYGEALPVLRILRQRVEEVYGFIREGRYDIYTDPSGYPRIPAARAVHPLVDPQLYPQQQGETVWRLPTVHDVFLYGHLPPPLRAESGLLEHIEAIIAYILDDRYQRLPQGYGLMWVQPNKYYGMGWSVHLPGFPGPEPVPGTLWALELLSPFAAARKHPWYRGTLARLLGDGHNGIWKFPASLLPEHSDKYYVGGGHMGLGEAATSQGRTLTSTAWMLGILAHNG